MESTRGQDDDTPQPPSPPDVMSKSTNIFQSRTKLTDFGSHRVTNGPTPQGRPSPSAPDMADMASSRMHTSRDTLPYEPQTPSRGTAFESHHPPDEDRGKARPDEQGLTDPSAAQHGPPAPEEHTPATTLPLLQGSTDPSATLYKPPAPPEHIPAMTEPPSSQQERNPSAIPHRLPVPPATTDPLTPQPVSGPRQSDRSNSHVQGNEGVDRAAEQAVGGPLPGSQVRKVIRRLVRPDEHENSLHPEILESQQISSRPNPTTSSEVRDGPVTAQPVPLGLYHPLAQNRRGDQLYGLTHTESRGGLPPPGQRRGLSKKREDAGQSREVGVPHEVGLPREVELPLEVALPREGGRSPPGPRAQSPEKRASFWCCC
ncbi:hypothetical protein DFH94DRAFT_758739 [Russula ochroleuca]|jgi:hypothetical protein|uniref:Uncharacterized protein n=1 Tax=Russula ochroleuca TaxID=152965 RepID=A0A9P5MRX6_9AGAM|nr:hypothetical protein DFH94DRAFT_758739 [Russula ochroleuca]